MSWPPMPSVPSVWHAPNIAAGTQAPPVNMGMYQQQQQQQTTDSTNLYQQYALQQQSWEQWQIYQSQLAQWQAQYGEQVS